MVLFLAVVFPTNKCHNHNNKYVIASLNITLFDSIAIMFNICFYLEVNRKQNHLLNQFSDHQMCICVCLRAPAPLLSRFQSLSWKPETQLNICRFLLLSEYLMTGSPRTAGYPARSPMSIDAPNQHRYVILIAIFFSSILSKQIQWISFLYYIDELKNVSSFFHPLKCFFNCWRN